MNQTSTTRQGVIYALAAYIIWGIAPIYFKMLRAIPAPEILAHRIIWSCVLILFLVWLSQSWSEVYSAIHRKKQLLVLMITAVLIGGNWLTFIWAINSDHLLDASLGYFINPLVNVVMGMIFLKERFRRLQWFAVALATMGVLFEVIRFGSLPWIAIVLALTFSCYGLLRKQVSIGALPGLFIETALLLPLALLYLFFFDHSATSHLTHNPLTLNLLLVSAGAVTTIPLLFFTGAARRLRLSTLGFFQYIGPSIMFILAILFYDEPFNTNKLLTFVFIWGALIIFSIDAINQRQRGRMS
ncbi:MAG: Protein RarD [Candidatus Celerinatantimonas neptuna]|nr:MAG: Protein RarD [Candidatus Celerinatantimonas neptuna]